MGNNRRNLGHKERLCELVGGYHATLIILTVLVGVSHYLTHAVSLAKLKTASLSYVTLEIKYNK